MDQKVFKNIINFQGEDVAGLDVTALEELQNLHVEAITKISHAKVILCLLSTDVLVALS